MPLAGIRWPALSPQVGMDGPSIPREDHSIVDLKVHVWLSVILLSFFPLPLSHNFFSNFLLHAGFGILFTKLLWGTDRRAVSVFRFVREQINTLGSL